MTKAKSKSKSKSTATKEKSNIIKEVQDTLDLYFKEEVKIKEIIDDIGKMLILPENEKDFEERHVILIKDTLCMLKNIKKEVSHSIIDFGIAREVRLVRDGKE